MERTYSEQEMVRRNKVEEIKNYCNPYPEKFERTHTLKEAKVLADGVTDVKIAGRIVFARKMGKLSFVRIRDLEADMQLEMKVDSVGEEKYEFFKKLIDTGDFIGAEGEIFTTQTGEKTLRVHELTFLGKALRPLPEKFHGLTDIEEKYRQRYVDLIMNETSRKVFIGRSKFYSFLHRYLDSHGFLEVETPILQNTVSGASAKPFYTHHNALDMDCTLRIAPEIYLKECIVAGYDKVYEVSKCFRNEGMDPQHLQEFTQVEWYCAYWRYEDNIKFFTEFIREALKELTGSEVLNYQGMEIDFSKKEWKRLDYCKELKKILGFDALKITDSKELKDKIVETGLFSYADLEEAKSCGQLIDFVYKRKIREGILEPTIIYNYPAVLMPLTRRNDENDKMVDMFQVVAVGTELCKAYSELVDPKIQREAFIDQLKAKEQGDDETMDLDEGFLSSMEAGMPPISGLGFGVDRLMMLLFDTPSIRDVVLFPQMKDESGVKRVVKAVDNNKEVKTIDLSKVEIEPLFEDYVDFETFSKSDFRVVKVKDCVAVEKSKKLLRFTLDDGTGVDRTILSGIHAFYEPEELIGKTCIAITNLPPRPMMGIDSCGMLISAVCKYNGEEHLNLLMVDDNIPAGSKLY